MILTKVTRTLAPPGFVPAGKLSHSYCGLLPVLALCMATAAWSQTAPAFRGSRVPPNMLSGVQAATLAADAQASAQYRFVSIDIPGSTDAYAPGIDNAGVVTGWYSDASNVYSGFVWRNGTLHSLDSLGSADTALQSVSNRVVAIGYYGDNTTAHAAMYSFASGAWTTLPDIAGMPNNEGFGINRSGVAVGYAGGGDFNSLSNPTSWIWDPTAQSYSFFAVPEAAQYSTYAQAINDKGQIAGTFWDTSGVAHGFLKDGQTYTTIDVPGAACTYVYGLNNSGGIVGSGCFAGGFVRTPDGRFTIVNFPGGLEANVGGINDWGDICGDWADPKTGFWTAFVGFKQ